MPYNPASSKSRYLFLTTQLKSTKTACLLSCLVGTYPLCVQAGNTFDQPATARGTSINPNRSFPQLALQPVPGRGTPVTPNRSIPRLDLQPVVSQEERIYMQNFLPKLQAVFNQIMVSTDKEIVVFFGRTGAGKSTSINFLDPRIRMIATPYCEIDLDPRNPGQNPLAIGTDPNESKTLYPECHQMDDGSFFVDLPGLEDTRGPEQVLINAAFIRKVLRNARAVKFVFVIGAEQFTSREGSASQTLRQIASMYNEDFYGQLIKRHSLLLVTRSDGATLKNVERKFERDDLLRPYWCEAGKICCIPKPTHPNTPIDVSMRQSILEKIRACYSSEEHTKNFDVSGAVSLEAKNYMRKFFEVNMETIRDQILGDSPNSASLGVPELSRLLNAYTRSVQAWRDAVEKSPIVQLLSPFAARAEYTQQLQNFEKDVVERANNYKTIVEEGVKIKREEEQRRIAERRQQEEVQARVAAEREAQRARAIQEEQTQRIDQIQRQMRQQEEETARQIQEMRQETERQRRQQQEELTQQREHLRTQEQRHEQLRAQEQQREQTQRIDRETRYNRAEREIPNDFKLASKILLSLEYYTNQATPAEKRIQDIENPIVTAARKTVAEFYERAGDSYMAGEWRFSATLSGPFTVEMARDNLVWNRKPTKNAKGYDEYSREKRQ